MLKGIRAILIAVLLASHINLYAQAVNQIVPAPVSFVAEAGKGFVLDNETVIYFSSQFDRQAIYLQEQIKAQLGFAPKLNLLIKREVLPNAAIVLEGGQANIDRPEMYTLVVNEQRLHIKANDVRGVVNAIQTLL
ncbi:MAG: glycoside hydrolase family 20 zincin-like fold domain-containing protein, partial [Chitinophagaceae bacterium]